MYFYLHMLRDEHQTSGQNNRVLLSHACAAIKKLIQFCWKRCVCVPRLWHFSSALSFAFPVFLVLQEFNHRRQPLSWAGARIRGERRAFPGTSLFLLPLMGASSPNSLYEFCLMLWHDDFIVCFSSLRQYKHFNKVTPDWKISLYKIFCLWIILSSKNSILFWQETSQ